MNNPPSTPSLADFLDLIYSDAYNNNATDASAATSPVGSPSIAAPAASDDSLDAEPLASSEGGAGPCMVIDWSQISPAPLEAPTGPETEEALENPSPAPVPARPGHLPPPESQAHACISLSFQILATMRLSGIRTNVAPMPVKKMKSHKLSDKMCAERFNGIIDFVTPRIGRNLTVKMPMVRNSAWLHLVQLETTEQQLKQVTEMFLGWKEAGNTFDDTFSELFV
ncbi:hypothetical protein H0H87_005980, partial [Tephrocybe sp. NHM501043]